MEVLFRIADKDQTHATPDAGDTISVQDDGAYWSERELTNPCWRIARIADLLQTDRDLLLAAPIDPPDGKFRRRDWYIETSKLPAPERFAGDRTQDIITMSRAVFIAALTKKESLE